MRHHTSKSRMRQLIQRGALGPTLWADMPYRGNSIRSARSGGTGGTGGTAATGNRPLGRVQAADLARDLIESGWRSRPNLEFEGAAHRSIMFDRAADPAQNPKWRDLK